MKNFMVHYTVDSSQKLGLNFDNILIAEINLYLILFLFIVYLYEYAQQL